MPPVYNLASMSETELDMFGNEVEMWRNEEFMVPIDSNEAKGTVSIMPVKQLHKPSTPVRPVLDYRWINSLIKSYPNVSLDSPIAAPKFIRKWRVLPKRKMCILDIRKAYLQIFVSSRQTSFQCVRYPDRNSWYRMERLGFGLAIAPKVLRTVIEERLPPEENQDLDTYVDDSHLPEEEADKVREELLVHGFETKPPEPILETCILGLKNSPDGTWTRKKDLPRLEKRTKRGVHAWCGKLTAHFPVCGWLRLPCSQLKRSCSEGLEWDDKLTPAMERMCDKLQKDIDKRGDPCRGRWYFDP